MSSWTRRPRRDESDLVPPEPTEPLRAFRYLSLLWLIYLIEPVVVAWQARTSPHGLLGLACVVVFAAVWIWHFLTARALRLSWVDRLPGQPVPVMVHVRYGLLVVLTLVATLALGQKATAMWVFVAIGSLWTFGRWIPYAITGALMVLYEVLAYRLDSWDRDNSQSIAIALGVIAVTGVMIAVRRSRDLSEARRENARLAVEEERNRVARDLHDILGHSLTVIRVKAELASRLIDLDTAKAKAEVEAVETLAREALADVRGTVEGFREISLAGEIARARVALESAGIGADLPRRVDEIDPALREVYAWTVREGVTNVIRHSGARMCTVTIDASGLRLADDGTVPLPGPAGRAHGHGLTGLAERARAAGATLTARRLEPRGFELRVSSTEDEGGMA